MSIDPADPRPTLGRSAERIAAEFLTQTLGWRIWRRNWRCRFGELDIVSWDADTLVVVEVRARSSDRFGSAQAAVDIPKARQILRLTPLLLLDPALRDCATVRFDVITLQFSRSVVTSFHHVRDAFAGLY